MCNIYNSNRLYNIVHLCVSLFYIILIMKSVFLFSLFLLSILAHGQEFSFVSKEYHKLTDTEIAVIVSEKRISKPVKYLEDGTLITDELAASLELTKNGYKYKQILFGDQEGNLKVVVLQLYTPEEIKQRNTDLNDKINLSSKILKGYKGTTAPEFDLVDLQGNHYTLENLKGKVVVLNFWFIKCGACLQEMPDLNKLVEKYKDKPIVFLAITHDEATSVTEFLKKKEILLTVIPNEQKTIKNYQIQFFPTNIILDQEGKVVFAKDGFERDMIKLMNKTIEKLLE